MEETPHDVGLHDEDEKRSVLKKVKDKAKKLKDTLKLYGHGHNHHEEGHVPDDHDLDDQEEDDQGEEMVDDPKIHGAYSATKSSELGHEKRSPAMEGTDPMNPQLKVAVERTSGIKEVPRAPTNTPASITPGIVQEQEVSARKPELNLEGLTSLEEDSHAPKDRPGDYIPSNYQSKVADPTGAGGEAACISQVLRSLDKVSVSGDGEQGSKQILSTGSHDQISPEPIKQDNTLEPGTQTGQETSRIATLPVDYGKRVATTMTEKLGPMYEKVAEAGHMVTEKLSPVYQKVSEAGSTVLSKVHGNQEAKRSSKVHGNEEAKSGIEGQDKRVPVKPELKPEDPHAPKDRPGDYIPSNYQSKVADPTGAGGEVAGVSQVLRSLDKVSVSGDEEQGSKQNLSSGSHDQISPESIKQDNTQEPGTRTRQETLPHALKDRPGDYIPSNYQSKVADPTGAGGEAAGVSQVLRSLEKVSVSVDGEQGSEQIPSTGSYDQISPKPIKQDNTHEPGTRTGQETPPHTPKDRPGDYIPSNYHSKVVDPTGARGDVAGVSQVLRSLDKVSVSGDGEQGSKQIISAGSHDQISPKPIKQDNTQEPGIRTGQETPPHAPKDRLGDYIPSNYQSKVADPTGAVSVSGDEEQGSKQILSSGSQDQISPEPIKQEHTQEPGTWTRQETPPHALKDRPGDYIPSNYQSKVADPTGAGGEEASVSQVLRSLEKVIVSDDGEQGSKQIPSTGSHDQISPEPINQDNTHEPGTRTGQEIPPLAPKDRPGDYIPSNYHSEVADPTGARGEVVGVSQVLRSLDKVSVSGDGEQGSKQIISTGSHDQISPELIKQDNTQEPGIRTGQETPPHAPKDQEPGIRTGQETPPHAPKDRLGDYIPSNYQSKVADPIGTGGEVAGVSQVLRSLDKVSVSGDGEQGSKQIPSTGSHDQISPEPIKQDNTQESGTRTGQETSRTDTLPVGYGKRVATTMTEKLSPVYHKVSEAGSTVLSKVHGNEEAKRGIEGQDKGVSVKDYIAEKFRPREEDKALSEVISDALHKRRERTDETEKQIGKVTESEEVRRQLGSHSDASHEEGKVPSSAFIPGKGVVGKVKGAVGSWFGKGEVSRPSQQSLGSSTGPEGFSTSATAETGERRLQEAGN